MLLIDLIRIFCSFFSLGSFTAWYQRCKKVCRTKEKTDISTSGFIIYIYYSCCLFVDICCPCESHSGTEYTNEVKLLPIHALLLFRIISYNTIVIEVAFLLKKNLKCPLFVKFFL